MKLSTFKSRPLYIKYTHIHTHTRNNNYSLLNGMKDKIAQRNLDRWVPRIRSIKIVTRKSGQTVGKVVTILKRRNGHMNVYTRARVWLVVCKRH